MTKEHNKVALITGGTDGVGFSIAKALAEADYSVHVVGSNAQKGQAVEKALSSLGAAKFWQVDLSNMEAVSDFAKAFSREVKQLDRLVFSAGVLLPKRMETEQGFEKTFAINYLSCYLLSHRLQPLLEKSLQPRVLTVSGGGAIVMRKLVNFDDIHLKKYSAPKAAARAVHAKVVLSQVLAEQWKHAGIAVNSFHPGIVKGGLGNNLPGPLSLAFKSAAMLMPKECKTGKFAALSPKMEGVSGYFLESRKHKQIQFDAEYCERLMHETELMLGEWLAK